MNREIEKILPDDVLLGRGPLRYLHPGNVVFRNLVRSLAFHYQIETPSVKKQLIVQHIFEIVLRNGGRFLYKDSPKSEKWNECTPSLAIKKIKHALRDARSLTAKKERKVLQKMILEKSSSQQESETVRSIAEPIRDSMITRTPDWEPIMHNFPIPAFDLPHKNMDNIEMLRVEGEIQSRHINQCATLLEQPSIIHVSECREDAKSSSWHDNRSRNDVIDSDDFFTLCIQWLANAS
jgi:hypothetical protein